MLLEQDHEDPEEEQEEYQDFLEQYHNQNLNQLEGHVLKEEEDQDFHAGRNLELVAMEEVQNWKYELVLGSLKDGRVSLVLWVHDQQLDLAWLLDGVLLLEVGLQELDEIWSEEDDRVPEDGHKLGNWGILLVLEAGGDGLSQEEELEKVGGDKEDLEDLLDGNLGVVLNDELAREKE